MIGRMREKRAKIWHSKLKGCKQNEVMLRANEIELSTYLTLKYVYYLILLKTETIFYFKYMNLTCICSMKF